MQQQPTQTIGGSQALFQQALLAYCWRHRYSEAEVLYQQALKLDPGLISGRVWYAILLTKQGRPGEAAAQLQEALRSDSASAEMRLEIARQQEPGDDAILSLSGLLEIRRGNPNAAQDWFEQALRCAPENLATLIWMAQSLASERDYAGAARYLARAQALSPKNPDVMQMSEAMEHVQSIAPSLDLASNSEIEMGQRSPQAEDEIESGLTVTAQESPEDSQAVSSEEHIIQPVEAVPPETESEPVHPIESEASSRAADVPVPVQTVSESPQLRQPTPEAQMVPCPRCQENVRGSAKFCPHCGKKLRCSACGFALSDRARFCPRCGAPYS